ncbi:F-box domain containing protein [Mycena venus]|uniref:F-box domain containing protein n=1 Tax=Mycena venus TaxID=2733690 RepID=A0A8H6X4Z5_9AGAR|nr:F-box domain containing protein [Mycena venus]
MSLGIVNIDKRQFIDPMDDCYGWKIQEYLANDMPLDLVWLFTIPVDNKSAPAPPTDQSGKPPRVPVGHWAGDRVFIVDQECGWTLEHLLTPEDITELVAQYPAATSNPLLLEFALENFEGVRLPGYRHAGTADTLFPADRVWVVRNLTERWYARADALLDPEDCCGPTLADRHGLGLGDLIWADIGGAPSARVVRDHRWGATGSMGHRLDVQPLEIIQNSADAAQWVDRSEEAKECLHEMNMELDVCEYRY